MRHLLLLAAIFSIKILACEAPPEEQHVSTEELISRTSDIVLARAAKVDLTEDNWHVSYTFRVEKRLKGGLPAEFTVIGEPPNDSFPTSFNHHREKRFWEKYGGHEYNGTDCEISPSFKIGSTYLIFYNQPYHNKGFELITQPHGNSSEKDKWLQYVEEKIVP